MNAFLPSRKKLRWAARAALVLLMGGMAVNFTPLSAEATSRMDSSLFSEDQAKRGSVVLETHCAVCHGAQLTGGGGSPPLQGPDFLFGWSAKTTKELVEYIATNMPPGQGHSLTDQQYEDVTAYILGANGFPAGQTPLTPANPRPIGEPPEAAQ